MATYKPPTREAIEAKYIGKRYGVYIVSRVLAKQSTTQWIEMKCTACGYTFQTTVATLGRYSRHDSCACESIRNNIRSNIRVRQLRQQRSMIMTQFDALEAIFNTIIREKQFGVATN